MKKSNSPTPLCILLTSSGSGRRVRLTRAFEARLAQRKPAGRLLTMDMNPLQPGLYMWPDSFVAPASDAPEFIPWLLKLCKKQKITAVIPTTDMDLEVLSRQAELFQEHGTQILSSPHRTIETCNNKDRFYRFFGAQGIAVPEILPLETKSRKFPLFIKPALGSGSRGATKVMNERELTFWTSELKQPVLTEFIEGMEYTIDVFLDREGKPVSIVPRQRLATRAGVSDIGRTVKDPDLFRAAAKVCSCLQFVGPINMQFIRRKGKLHLIEINPRFSGGISLTLAAGADFAELALRLIEGRELKPGIGKFQSDLLMMVYEQAFYISGDKLKKSLPAGKR
jgi:carbamoyl-phosphate synthase large subunit